MRLVREGNRCRRERESGGVRECLRRREGKDGAATCPRPLAAQLPLGIVRFIAPEEADMEVNDARGEVFEEWEGGREEPVRPQRVSFWRESPARCHTGVHSGDKACLSSSSSNSRIRGGRDPREAGSEEGVSEAEGPRRPASSHGCSALICSTWSCGKRASSRRGVLPALQQTNCTSGGVEEVVYGAHETIEQRQRPYPQLTQRRGQGGYRFGESCRRRGVHERSVERERETGWRAREKHHTLFEGLLLTFSVVTPPAWRKR